MADALVAELRAQIRSRGFNTLRNGCAHVNLKQEMHAAAKVEAEIHRAAVEREEPVGRIRGEVERGNVARILRIGIKRAVDDFTRFKLLFSLRRIKANANRVLLRALLKIDAVGGELRVGKRLLDLTERLLRHLGRRLGGCDLYRRRFAVKIRQRVDQADQ